MLQWTIPKPDILFYCPALEQMARNVDTIKNATEAIFILKFKTTTYCSAKHSRSVTEKKILTMIICSSANVFI